MIDINLSKNKSQLCLSVSNSTEDISPQQHERLFERFYRVNQGQSSGSGLGLSIVQQCAEIHQASIEIPPVDSLFVIHICFAIN